MVHIASVRVWWTSHERRVLGGAVIVMAAASAGWLTYEFFRFFQQPSWIGSRPIHPGAIDLKIFHSMVNAWFAGAPVYTGETGWINTHPPATMALMWPFYGWHALNAAMIAWTGTAVAALACLVCLVVHESGAETPHERAFAALLPLAIYPTGAILGNGQMVLHEVSALLAGLLLLRRRSSGWRMDTLAALLILLALAKATVAAPFFWIVVFAARSYRPAILVGAGYVALTVFAATFQQASTFELFHQFLARASAMSTTAGESNVHILLAHLDLKEWIAAASLTMLCLHGIWVWYHRRVDLWLLIGVTAIVARFWSYHRWYDDLLIVLPMAALFRVTKRSPRSGSMGVVAGLLLGWTLILMMAPGGLYLLPTPWNNIYQGAQVFTWLSVMTFMVIAARRERACAEGMLQRVRLPSSGDFPGATRGTGNGWLQQFSL